MELRESIKHFSNWPTVPQLYVMVSSSVVAIPYGNVSVGELEAILTEAGIPHEAASLDQACV